MTGRFAEVRELEGQLAAKIAEVRDLQDRLRAAKAGIGREVVAAIRGFEKRSGGGTG